MSGENELLLKIKIEIMKKLLLIFLMSIVGIFLSFSFILMDLNPFNWDMAQRFLMLFLSVCLVIITITIDNVSKL